jgi:predicted nucleic acid-binding protein
MIYLLDTTAISDILIGQGRTKQQTDQHQLDGHVVGFIRPVYYEIMRGLLWKTATAKLTAFQNGLIPTLDYIPMDDSDWDQAAQYWAMVVRAGRQLSDVDLLLASVAARLNATLVSSDRDFDVLPVTRQDWRI